MFRTPKSVLDMIPVVDENGYPVSDFTNKNEPLMITKDGQLIRGENKNSAMNVMREYFA